MAAVYASDLMSKASAALVAQQSIMLFGAAFLLMAPALGTAALNCTSQQCIQVQYKVGTNGYNMYCWTTSSNSQAYSTTYADWGYGQNALPGTPGTPINGWDVGVTAHGDCPVLVLPESGTVDKVNTKPINLPFNTECVLKI